MELAEVLSWILSGGGAGVIAYLLMDKVWQLAELPAEKKRYVALGLAAGIAWVAYLFTLGMEYQAPPQDVRAWIEALFSIAAVAVGLSQVIHGRRDLRGRT